MGGSGGGSSSGAVSYPEYMQTQHGAWLTAVASAITTAQTGDSPYSAVTAYDPDCVLAATNYILSLFYDEVLAMDPATDWSTYYAAAAAKYTAVTITAITAYTFSPTISQYSFDSSILSAAALTALVSAYQSDLEARRDASYKPSFKVGALNVGAVNASAFVLGETLITAEVAREVAKFSADLYFQNEQKKIEYEQIKSQENSAHNANVISYEQVKSGSANQHNANITKRDALVVTNATANLTFNASVAESIMAKDVQHLGLYQALAQLTTEANRVKIVAKTEENERNIKFDALDATWDLEMFQYGGNVLASISGAASQTTGKDVSTAQSVLGGAASGAAMGTAIMPGIGTGIGAILGGLSGLLG